MPYFTIVIPSYNRGHIVGRAIESVLNQSYSDFEIIVVADGNLSKMNII
jgi:glycosyltransferase involved in cell wall biosynthesis